MSYQIVAISNEKGPEEQALNKLERAGASAGEILYAYVEHFCRNFVRPMELLLPLFLNCILWNIL